MGVARQSAPTQQKRWYFICKCGNAGSAPRKETMVILGWKPAEEDQEHDICPTCVLEDEA